MQRKQITQKTWETPMECQQAIPQYEECDRTTSRDAQHCDELT